jgi:ubiquitin C-terminal hydrolase
VNRFIRQTGLDKLLSSEASKSKVSDPRGQDALPQDDFCPRIWHPRPLNAMAAVFGSDDGALPRKVDTRPRNKGPSASTQNAAQLPRDIVFRARAVIQSNVGEKPRESNVAVEYTADFKPGRGVGSLALRTMRRTRNGETASSYPTVFSVRGCIHLTPHHLFRKGNHLSIHFDKVGGDDATGRTKFHNVNLRGWSKQALPDVNRLYDILSDAVQDSKDRKPEDKVNGKYGSEKKLRKKSTVPPRDVRAPSSNVDESLRNSERKRSAQLESKSQRLAACSLTVSEPSLAKTFRSNLLAPKKPGKYAALGDLVGPPVDANEPLHSSKVDKMRARSQYSRIAAMSQVPAVSKKRLLSALPQSRTQQLPRGHSTVHYAAPPESKRQKSLPCYDEESVGSDASPPRTNPISLSQRPSISLHKTRTEIIRQASQSQAACVPTDRKSLASFDQSPAALKAGFRSVRVSTGQAGRALRSSGIALPNISSHGNGGGGIVNIGNTCYLGAALQALLNDTTFLADIRQRVASITPSAAPFARALIDMDHSRDYPAAHLRPELVQTAIASHFEEFGTTAQQDAQEFFTRCLYVLEGEVGTVPSKCPVTRSFSLVMENLNACTDCGHASKPRKELFHDLSLDIPLPESSVGRGFESDDASATNAAKAVADEFGVVDLDAGNSNIQLLSRPNDRSSPTTSSLDDLVVNYFDKHQVELNCEKSGCNGKHALKHTEVVLAPRILVLHLKRFRVESSGNASNFSLVKVSDRVKIPASLDLASVQSANACGPSVFDQASLLSPRQSYTHKSAGGDSNDSPSALPPRSRSLVPGRSRVDLPEPAFIQETHLQTPTASQRTRDIMTIGDDIDVGADDDIIMSSVFPQTSTDLRDTDATQTQLLTPIATQFPVYKRQRSGTTTGPLIRAATPILTPALSTATRTRATQTPATMGQPRRLFHVAGADDTPAGKAKNWKRNTSEGEVNRMGMTGMEVIAIDDEVEDVEECWWQTQALSHGLDAEAEKENAHTNTDEAGVRQLSGRMNVSEDAARAALVQTHYDQTRAAGVLLDSAKVKDDIVVAAEKDRVSAVLELVERTRAAGGGRGGRPGVYRLCGIVRHRSSVAEYGHYIADIRQRDGSWVTYDDCSVLKCAGKPYETEERERDGYLFFYEMT